jgi:hypothetical protein
MKPLVLVAFLSAVAFPAMAAPVPTGGACVADSECAVGTVCDGGFCAPVSHDRKIVPPFYFRKKGPEGYHDITPLLWFHHWNRESDTKVQFPFYFEKTDKTAGETTFAIPLLLFGATKSATEKFATVLPFFWWKRGKDKSYTVIPLLLAGSTRDEKTGETWRIQFPLFFNHETKDGSWTVAPLVWASRSPGHTASVFFPLVWHVKDTVQGSEHLVIIPLFDWQSDARGRHERIASLIGGWEHDDDAGLKQGLLLTPLMFYRKDPQRTVFVLPPVFTRWRVHSDGSSGWIFGPVFHSTDPEGSTSGFFPIYWQWHDNHTGATTNWIFPIAGFHRRPDARGGYIGPAYGWSSNKGWGAGLAPIAFFGRNEHKHHAVIAPIFARVSDDQAGTSTTQVGPVYYHKAKDGYDAGVVPLLFAGRHGDKTYGTFAPIYWHFGQKDGATDVAGPVYVQRGADGWRAGLAPILFLGNKGGHEHEVLFPIFWRFVDHKRQQEKMLVGPFYHSRDRNATTDVLFPLMYLHRTPGRGLLVTPLGGWSKEPGKSTLVVGPWIQHDDDRQHTRTRVLFPLGASYDAPNYHITLQFPFYWRVHDGDETDTVVFPLYWRVRSPHMQFDGLFPLFLHAKNDTATTTVAGPVWLRTRNDGGRSLGLFPLFAYGENHKDGKAARWFGMPGVFYRENQRFGSSELIVGPFYDIHRSYGYDAGVPPVFFAWRRNTASFVVTPIFYRQQDTAADSSLNVLGPLYFGHNGPTKKVGLFPLLFVSAKPGEGSGGVFPLIYVHKKPVGSLATTLLFGWSTYKDGWRFWLGPIYARRDHDYSSTAVWPLAYFMKNKTTGASLNFVLPFYFDGRTHDGRELQVMTPLIWRYHSVESTITVGLPFFFDVNRFGESRTTGFLPFFMRNKSYAEKSVSYTIPFALFWARKRDGGKDPGTDVVWFPLFWHYGGQDSTTVVLPVFWDLKRGESRTLLAMPVFAYWKRPDAKRYIALNMYYRRGINHEEGNWHCYIVPFADFGRPRKKDIEWNVLLGLFGYKREGRARTLKLFWFVDIKLEDVPASNLAWFGSTDSSARTEF